MRSSAVVTFALPWLLLAGTAALHAGEATQRLDWKLEDFQPLTELPWSANMKEPMAEVLTAIFREPDPQIRYLTLAWYLRKIPEAQLATAFDRCIIMEGSNTPGELIEFFLRIWAERDPVACWERTRGLFQLIGIEHGWLNYDSWKERDKITVRDAKAIQRSRFWIENEIWLLGFPSGVEASSLPKEEKVKLFRSFADSWFTAFQSWPAGFSSPQSYPTLEAADLIGAFTTTPELMRETTRGDISDPDYRAAVEVGLRRWLKAEPKAALEIIKKRSELLAPEREGGKQPLPVDPPVEWLMIWRQVELPAMTKWVESLEIGEWRSGTRIRGMIMSWVDERTRERWLKEAKKESESTFVALLGHWAGWNPQHAMEAALATKESYIVQLVADDAVYGHLNYLKNTSHPGLGFIRDFDAYTLCKGFPDDIRSEWGIIIMEQWGDIDVGEAARYGLDFILKSDYAPREGLLRFFGGKSDEFADGADMIDRTFCCLRIWAVTKPGEMKAWIASLKDNEMRDALTWLLENPWGTGNGE